MDEEADYEDYEEFDGKLPHPESSNFYSGRSAYFDQTNVLEDALKHTRRALTNLSLLPLPAFARAALPPFQPVWKPKAQMGQAIGMRLKTSRYRKLTALLNQLDEHKRIAQAAGYNELAEGIILVLALFERENKEAVLMRGRRKPVKFDDYGRSYTLGKRKESSARVWMIAVKERPQEVGSASVDQATEELLALKQANPDLAASNVPIERPEDSVRAGDLPTTNILINNVPLIQYLYVVTFPLSAYHVLTLSHLALNLVTANVLSDHSKSLVFSEHIMFSPWCEVVERLDRVVLSHTVLRRDWVHTYPRFTSFCGKVN